MEVFSGMTKEPLLESATLPSAVADGKILDSYSEQEKFNEVQTQELKQRGQVLG